MNEVTFEELVKYLKSVIVLAEEPVEVRSFALDLLLKLEKMVKNDGTSK